MSKTLEIIQNNCVSHIFMRMVLDIVNEHSTQTSNSEFKELLPYYFKEKFNVELNFKTLTLTFSSENDLTLALLKYD